METEPFRYICTCKHPRCAHNVDDGKWGRCNSYDAIMQLGMCRCEHFQMDNLRYLEKLACDE